MKKKKSFRQHTTQTDLFIHNQNAYITVQYQFNM